MGKIRALVKISRIETSVVIFLSIFGPVYSNSRDLLGSLIGSAPAFFISLCTFIINDLEDVERDKVNHPERPLPSGEIYPSLVACVYFFFLFAALFSIRGVGNRAAAFIYYAMLIMVISYGRIKENLASLKSIYVSAVSTLPVLVAIQFATSPRGLAPVVAAVFFFTLGRELCMDFRDREGDTKSFIQRISRRDLSRCAFLLQAVGVSFFWLSVKDPLGVFVAMSLVALLLFGFYLWEYVQSYEGWLYATKVQMFMGLYFLL